MIGTTIKVEALFRNISKVKSSMTCDRDSVLKDS